jgi:hypothetical protein
MQAELARTDIGQLSESIPDISGQPIEDDSIVIYKYSGYNR